MSNYKNKYKLLLESVNEIGNESLKGIAADIDKMKAEPGQQENQIAKKDIMEIKDNEKRVKAIAENLELFKKGGKA